MKSETLDKIDNETCVHKVRSMKNLSLSESVEKCRTCTKEIELNCKDYKPISNYQQPIRRGCLALHYFWYKKGDKQ